VRGLEKQGQPSADVRAGERAAVALSGLAAGEVARGETLVTEPDWSAARTITVQLRTLAELARPLCDRQRVHLHLGTAVVTARLRLHEDLRPGSTGLAVLQLEHPTVLRSGDRFIIRSYSPMTTIAGGRVLEWSGTRYRRRVRDVAKLEHLAHPDPESQNDALLDLAGWRGIEAHLFRLHASHGLNTPPAAILAGGRLYHAGLGQALSEHMLRRLAELHDQYPLRTAVDTEAVRQAGSQTAPLALRAHVLSELIRRGSVRQSAAGVSLPDRSPRQSAQDRALLASVRARLDQAGLTPLAGSEIQAEFGPDGREAVRLLLDEGHLVQIASDLFMSVSACHRARQLVLKLGTGPLSPADFREALGLSRKHLIPLLEYFDRTGLTRRTGDQRILESVEAVSDLGGATP
jgi:selenocysteine-specific elongation factor